MTISAPSVVRFANDTAPLATRRQKPADRSQTMGPSDSIKGLSFAGWMIVAAFFGGLGTWSVTAPLNSAVVANAVVKVEGNRKSVQHLDGGIVKELRIKEGSTVKIGDVLIVLDDSQARAEFDILSQQYIVLRATEARLLAEFSGAHTLSMPRELAERQNDPYVADIWQGQVKQFETRRAAIEGQRNVLREKVNQLQSQIGGTEAQLKSFSDQILSVRTEAESIGPLVEKGLLPRPRLLQLERSSYGLEGQIADARANAAKHRQAIAEQELHIAQLANDRLAEITKELREVQARVLEVVPRLLHAKAVLSRLVIRSPYAGRVISLNAFSIDGVIQRGEKILDIVPEEQALTIDAQVAVEDISEVRPGMLAEVHLTAYKQRIVPVVRGEVTQVSADRLTDLKTNVPYYSATVRLNSNELDALPNVSLYPGMPATVTIPTEARTALDYIVGPLVMAFHHSFRQK